MTTHNQMRAMLLNEFGGKLKLTKMIQPEPAPHEVLVRVHASGVNPLDLKVKAGGAAHARVRPPAILGMDVAGVVVSVGRGVKKFKIDDEVYGLVGGIGGLQGTLAEYVVVDADLLAKKPRTLSMKEAAALPLIFITAWEGLVDRARVNEKKRVLIHGGAGGVGHIAIQLARANGAEVFATGSTRQQDAIRKQGATPINYETTTVDRYFADLTNGKGFDIVFDTVGGKTLDDSFRVAKRYEGHVVSALGWGTHSLASLSFRAATYSGVFTLLPILTGEGRAHHGNILAAAANLVDNGEIYPRVDHKQFFFETANEAHEYFESRNTNGKVVVESGLAY